MVSLSMAEFMASKERPNVGKKTTQQQQQQQQQQQKQKQKQQQQEKNGGGGGGKGRPQNKGENNKNGKPNKEEVDDHPYGFKYFSDWVNSLRDKLKQTLPKLPCQDIFVPCCKTVEDAFNALEAAEKAKEMIPKEPVDEDRVKNAQEEIEAAKKLLEEANATLQDIAATIFSQLEESLCSPSFDDSDLVTFTALASAEPKKLAAWCSKGEQETAQILALFNDTDQLRKFLEAGGPRQQEYGAAIEIYSQLHPDDPVLQRLALAVALELAGEIPEKVCKNEIDPLERYLHYEQAYLAGELDPAFSQFSVWEMRHIVDSDASNEELQWGRDSLKNYRPDFVLKNDPQWRYAEIVRSDVSYKKPDWYKEPKSYDQILSGGGKCGPRAWYGRFILKAFGIPVWGCKQPAHAALARWTSQGWMTCLGAAFKYSNWEGKCGNYFLLETQARSAVGNDAEYMRKFGRLQSVARLHGEPSRPVEQKGIPTEKCPWTSLSLMMLKLLSSSCTCKSLYENSGLETQLERLAKEPEVCEAITKDDHTGTVTIPATCCSRPNKQTNQVLFTKSFLGGRQIYLSKKAELEYTLGSEFLTTSKYKLTMQVCTVHRKEDPVLLKVNTKTTYEIPMPYTVGLWQETEPVEIEFGGQANQVLTFARQSPVHGISIKYIKLTPA